ncbi:hypothetical protein D3C80_1648640 [compost metagenome]
MASKYICSYFLCRCNYFPAKSHQKREQKIMAASYRNVPVYNNGNDCRFQPIWMVYSTAGDDFVRLGKSADAHYIFDLYGN